MGPRSLKLGHLIRAVEGDSQPVEDVPADERGRLGRVADRPGGCDHDAGDLDFHVVHTSIDAAA